MPFAVGIANGFFVANMFAGRSESRIGRASSALAKDQRGEWAALRHGGRRELDHDVSILIWPGEKARGARPGWNLSMTIMRPPQHGHGWSSTRVSG